MFAIEMLPAAHGDCLWLEYGERARLKRILIDGGVAPTFDAITARAAGQFSEYSSYWW